MHHEPRDLLARRAGRSTLHQAITWSAGPRRTPAAPGGSGPRTQAQNPAAFLYGPAHVVVHGNPAFVAEFGDAAVGLPAAETLLDLPRAAFRLMDRVFDEGRPLALWITVRGSRRRLTVIERRDSGTGEVYGIALHLVPAEPDCGSGTRAGEGNR